MKYFFGVLVLLLIATRSEATFFIDLDDARVKEKDKEAILALQNRQKELEELTLEAIARLNDRESRNQDLKQTDNLLLSKSTRHVFETGDKRPNEHLITGRVEKIPFSDAMQLLIPSEWDLYGHKDLISEAIQVSWSESDSWVSALERIGRENDLQFSVNWTSNSVFLSQSPDKGSLYASSPAAEVSVEGFNATVNENQFESKTIIGKTDSTQSNSVPCSKEIAFKEGHLRENLARVLSSCGYTLGSWNVGDRDYIFDYKIEKGYIFKSSGLADLIKYIRETYGIKAKIRGRTVYFFGLN